MDTERRRLVVTGLGAVDGPPRRDATLMLYKSFVNVQEYKKVSVGGSPVKGKACFVFEL